MTTFNLPGTGLINNRDMVLLVVAMLLIAAASAGYMVSRRRNM